MLNMIMRLVIFLIIYLKIHLLMIRMLIQTLTYRGFTNVENDIEQALRESCETVLKILMIVTKYQIYVMVVKKNLKLTTSF